MWINLWDVQKSGMVCRKNIKQTQLIPAIYSIFGNESVEVKIFNEYTDYEYNLRSERYVMHIKCASYTQLKKFEKFMINLNGGKEIKRK